MVEPGSGRPRLSRLDLLHQLEVLGKMGVQATAPGKSCLPQAHLDDSVDKRTWLSSKWQTERNCQGRDRS